MRARELRVETFNAESCDDLSTEPPTASGRSPGWLRRPRRKVATVTIAVLFICACLSVSGCLVWHHHSAMLERQHAAEFSVAARQAVVTLMSFDASKAKDDVQRIIDSTTGTAKAGMMVTAQDLVKSVEQSKVSTTVTVEGVAVESMTDDSAVVLIAAKSAVANPGPDKPGPRSWRLVANLQRDDGRLKVSKVEFLP